MSPQTVGQLLDTGNELLTINANEQAIALYGQWLTTHRTQDDGAVAFNLGVLLSNQGKLNDALAAYQLALQLNSRLYQARINLGLTLEKMGLHGLAIAVWRDGALEPSEQTQLLNQIGRLLENQKHLAMAEGVLRQSLALNPHQPAVVQHWAYLRARQCKWPALQPIMGLDSEIRPSEELIMDVGPFASMALCDRPEKLKAIASRWVKERGLDTMQKYHGPAASATPLKENRRIRVGYLSSDFRMHAVGMLAAPLFENHDKSKFEIFALDDTPSGHDGNVRERLLKAVEHHLPLQGLSEPDAAEKIYTLNLDILVDLTGMTAGARLGILARKPAPRTVSYIGFMGTMGMEAVDFILVDQHAMTSQMTPHFSETALLHPGCYQINEAVRDASQPPTRASQGLPEDAFVYCAFSNSYKITPEVFAVWMKVLSDVPASVLWLLADNESNSEQLRQQAQRHGVSSDRLIFAPRVSPQDYLARYACADLMLDSYPYGAGLTASDCLWMGLPILTCPGHVLASRMATSLLHALELDQQLVCGSWSEYQEKAIQISQQPQLARDIKQQLLTQGRSSDLFNPSLWVTQWENVITNMVTKN